MSSSMSSLMTSLPQTHETPALEKPKSRRTVARSTLFHAFRVMEALKRDEKSGIHVSLKYFSEIIGRPNVP